MFTPQAMFGCSNDVTCPGCNERVLSLQQLQFMRDRCEGQEFCSNIQACDSWWNTNLNCPPHLRARMILWWRCNGPQTQSRIDTVPSSVFDSCETGVAPYTHVQFVQCSNLILESHYSSIDDMMPIKIHPFLVCNWSQWASLGTCSGSCGTGRQEWRRRCGCFPPVQSHLRPPGSCPGLGTKLEDCNTNVPCPGLSYIIRIWYKTWFYDESGGSCKFRIRNV